MSQKKYLVTLTLDERDQLDDLLRKGKLSALAQTRARILRKADQADGGRALEGAAIAEDLEVGLRTISRVRPRFVERGFEGGLTRKAREKPSRQRPWMAPPKPNSSPSPVPTRRMIERRGPCNGWPTSGSS